MDTTLAARTGAFVQALGLSTSAPPAPSVLERLLRLPKPHAALQAVEARLANESWAALTRETIEAELRARNVQPRHVAERCLELYRRAVSVAVGDGRLDDEDIGALRQLASLLGVEPVAEGRELLTMAESHYRQTLTAAIADRWLTDAERGSLDGMAADLRLPQEILAAVHRDLMGHVIQKLFEEQTADRMFSPEEEAELRRVAANLGVDFTASDAAQGLIHRYRLLWEIDQGQLPELEVPVRLQRGERCYWHGDGRLHEFRSVTTAVRYSGPTARIRIARGLSWRVGHLAVNRVTQDILREIDAGTLYITSKRLIFDGSMKSTALPLRRVLSFTVYQDGVQIEKDSGKDQYFKLNEFDSELLGAILDAAIERSAGA